METMDRSTLEGKLLPELQQIAQTLGIEGTQRLRKAGLIDAIVEASSNGERPGNGEAKSSASLESSVATIERAPESARVADDGDEGDEGNEPQPTDGGNDRSTASVETGSPRRDDGRSGGEERPRDDRQQGGRGGSRPQGGDRDDRGDSGDRNDPRNRRRRPTREERRQMREERREREEQERIEALKTAPSASGILDLLPDGYG
ncbi:MAG: Rho termination factor, N-terminal domain, partial [Actinomycetia bacterium]|nr:Rho termination factor, N-terminal domain [Actinomycetes bacterium]